MLPSRSSRLLLTVLLAVAVAMTAWAGPKNVILMIGDGMGLEQMSAAGAYRFGAGYHAFGGEQCLAMDTLPHRGFITTYADGGAYDAGWQEGNAEYPTRGATDSAAAGTAFAAGVKTTNGAISVDPDKLPLRTILEIAQRDGRKTGIVSSVPLSHATPAAFAAHNESRNNYTALTADILRITQPDVVMGAGNPDAADDPANAYKYISEKDWTAVKRGDTPYRLVQSRDEFLALIDAPVSGKVLGMFRNQNCLPYCGADRSKADPECPTLAEMTHAALSTLENDHGFFLMVEGGAIDWCCHANDLDGSIGETLALDDAVAVTLEWIGAHGGWDDNLLIVTADHETGYLHNVQPTAAGQLPDVQWGTDGGWPHHTNRLVPLFAQGAGSGEFANLMKDIVDYEYGAIHCADNTTVFTVMHRALKPAAVAK